VLRRGAIGDFVEFVWCGYGEPTFRLDLILEAAPWLRSKGARIRLNTNGHACLINGRDVMGPLSEAVDEVSVSLNAPNARRYRELCLPDARAATYHGDSGSTSEKFWIAALDFLARAPARFQSVQASVVGPALTEDEIEQCRRLAQSLGIAKFRVR
jgi:TatD DNase family protein